MALAKMREATIFAHRRNAKSILTKLQSMGVLDLHEVKDDDFKFVCPHDYEKEVIAIDHELSECKYVLDFLDRYAKEKQNFIEGMLRVKQHVSDYDWNMAIMNYKEEISRFSQISKTFVAKLAALSNEEAKIKEEIANLKPFMGMDLDFSLLSENKTVFCFAAITVKLLNNSLSLINEECKEIAFSHVHTYKKTAYVLFAYPASSSLEAEKALSLVNLTYFNYDSYKGVPDDLVKDFEARLKGIEKRRDELMSDIKEFAKNQLQVKMIFDFLSNEKSKLEVLNELNGTDQTVIIQGWCLSNKLSDISKCLHSISPDIALIDREPSPEEDHPVELENNKVFAPYEMITKMMGLPKPGTIDPTPLFAPFFFVFFGLCLADAIYGIALIAFGFFLMRKLKLSKPTKMGIVFLIISSIGMILMGILLGGWMGDLFTRLFGIKPLWFDPIKQTMTFIGLSIALGVIQVFFGVCIKAYHNFKNGRYLSAIYDQIFWLVLLTGIGFMLGGSALGPAFSSVGKYMALGSAIGLVLTQGRHQKSIIMKLGSGIISLYNITGYLSDIVSYLRIFGLGISSAVIANVMNDLILNGPAQIPYFGIVIAVIGLLIAHIFNLVLNILGSFIHSCRLQYIEFFGKFFEVGGKKFSPFGIFTKYVEVEKVEEA